MMTQITQSLKTILLLVWKDGSSNYRNINPKWDLFQDSCYFKPALLFLLSLLALATWTGLWKSQWCYFGGSNTETVGTFFKGSYFDTIFFKFWNQNDLTGTLNKAIYPGRKTRKQWMNHYIFMAVFLQFSSKAWHIVTHLYECKLFIKMRSHRAKIYFRT